MPLIEPKSVFLKYIALFLVFIRFLYDSIQNLFLSKADSSVLNYKNFGFCKTQLSDYLDTKTADLLFNEIITNLDQLEQSRSLHPENFPSEKTSEELDYAFLQDMPFYRDRLGPRLRINYQTNNFTNWPLLSQKILVSKKYRYLLKALCGTESGTYKCYVEKTQLGGPHPQWHVDSISKIFRMQIYLCPVTKENGPMEYIQKSQLDSDLRSFKIKLKQHFNSESWHKDLEPNNTDDVVQFMGPSGTCFSFDSRGLHRATRSELSVRYSLMISFTPDTLLNRSLEYFRGGWAGCVQPITTLNESN
jgi:hypothetical protein